MFARMTAGRFEEGRTSPVGPGSYDVSTVLGCEKDERMGMQAKRRELDVGKTPMSRTVSLSCGSASEEADEFIAVTAASSLVQVAERLQQSEARNKELQRQFSDALAKLDGKSCRLVKCETRMAELQRTLDERVDCSSELLSARARCHELQSQLEGKRAEFDGRSACKSTCEERATESPEQFDEMSAKDDARLGRVVHCEDERPSRGAACVQADMELCRHAAAKEAAVAQSEAAATSAKALGVEAAKLRGELLTARKATQLAVEHGKAIEQELENERSRAEQMTDACAAVEVKLRSTTADLREATLHIDRLQNDFAATSADGLAQRQSLEEQVAELMAANVQLAADLEVERGRNEREDFAMINADFQDLRLQNRELSLSMHLFKEDCELLEAENLSLKETVAIFECDLERVTGHNANLVGHVNQKQKIRHTIKLKDENNQLRVELKNARQRVVQLELEAGRRSEGLLDAFSCSTGTATVRSLAAIARTPCDSPNVPHPGAVLASSLFSKRAVASGDGAASTTMRRRPATPPTAFGSRAPLVSAASSNGSTSPGGRPSSARARRGGGDRGATTLKTGSVAASGVLSKSSSGALSPSASMSSIRMGGNSGPVATISARAGGVVTSDFCRDTDAHGATTGIACGDASTAKMASAASATADDASTIVSGPVVSASGNGSRPDDVEGNRLVVASSRKLQLQECAIERLRTDLQHFVGLLERATGLSPSCAVIEVGGGGSRGAASGASPEIGPNADMLQRLRDALAQRRSISKKSRRFDQDSSKSAERQRGSAEGLEDSIHGLNEISLGEGRKGGA